MVRPQRTCSASNLPPDCVVATQCVPSPVLPKRRMHESRAAGHGEDMVNGTWQQTYRSQHVVPAPLPDKSYPCPFVARAGVLEVRFRGSPVDGAALIAALVVQLEESREVVAGTALSEVPCPIVVDNVGVDFSQVCRPPATLVCVCLRTSHKLDITPIRAQRGFLVRWGRPQH